MRTAATVPFLAALVLILFIPGASFGEQCATLESQVAPEVFQKRTGPITLRALVILIDFDDGLDDPMTCGGPNPWPNGSATAPSWTLDLLQDVGQPVLDGSLTHYYQLMTDNDIDLRGVTHPTVVHLGDIEWYNDTYVKGALEQACLDALGIVTNSLTPAEVDAFDHDGNGTMDQVFFFYREKSFYFSENLPRVFIKWPSGQFGFGGVAHIPPSQGTIYPVPNSTLTLRAGEGAILTPATSILGFENLVEIAAHEFGHATHPYWGIRFHQPDLGMYSLMHGTTGWRGSAAYTSTLTRWQNDWIDEKHEIVLGTDLLPGQEMQVTLKDVGAYGNEGFVVIRGPNSDDVFILEGRDPSATPFTGGVNDPAYFANFSGADQSPALCGGRRSPTGVLVTHLGTDTQTSGIIRTADGRFDVNTWDPNPVDGLTEIESKRHYWPTNPIAATGSDRAAFAPGDVWAPYTNSSTNWSSGTPAYSSESVYSGLTVYNFEWIVDPGIDGQGEIQFTIRYDGTTPPTDPHILPNQMTWGGAVQLMGDVEVPAGGNLTIQGDTIVAAARGQDDFGTGNSSSEVEILARGDLVAVGSTPIIPKNGQTFLDVVFTHTDDSDFRDRIGWVGTTTGGGGAWWGLRYLSDAVLQSTGCSEIPDGYTTGHRLNHVEIRNASEGITLEATGAPTIQDVDFVNSKIWLRGSDVYVPLLMNQCTSQFAWDLNGTARFKIENAVYSEAIPGGSSLIDIVAHGKVRTASTLARIRFEPDVLYPGGGNGLQWGGIDLDSRSAGSDFRDVEVGHAEIPLHFRGPDGDVVDNALLHAFHDAALVVEDAAGAGITVQNTEVLRGGLSPFVPEAGTTGFRVERSSVASLLDNTIDMSTHPGGATDVVRGVHVMADAAWCAVTPPSAELLEIKDTTIDGPGATIASVGLDLEWACANGNRTISISDNAVDGWSSGVRLQESPDVQFTCNALTSVDTGVENLRTQWPNDPPARFFKNHIVATTVAVTTNKGLKTKLGPNSFNKGKNVLEVAAGGAVLHRSDPVVSGTLNARDNTWRVGGTLLISEAEVRANSTDTAAGALVALIEADNTRSDVEPNCSGQVGGGFGLPNTLPEDPRKPVVEFIPLDVTPNPFNPMTTLRFTLAEASSVRLVVYSVAGRRVRTLVSRALEAGEHSIVWDGRDEAGGAVASGVFFAALEVNGDRALRKLVLVR